MNKIPLESKEEGRDLVQGAVLHVLSHCLSREMKMKMKIKMKMKMKMKMKEVCESLRWQC